MSLRGAGPSAGPVLRSQSPDLIRQEIAAWAAAVEMPAGSLPCPRAATTNGNRNRETHTDAQIPKAQGIAPSLGRRMPLLAVRDTANNLKTFFLR
jgi:hypothetical protein